MNKSKLIEELFSELLGETIHGGPYDDSSNKGGVESIYGRTDKTKHDKMDERETPKQKEIVLRWESVPMPQVSELAWSEPGSAERDEVQLFLSKIPEGNLASKIKDIQTVVTKGMPATAKLEEVLSYLVFLKTLTYIVQSFNRINCLINRV